MKESYDFSNGKRGAVLTPSPGKVRITIRLDSDIVGWFKDRVNDAGGGNYQALINMALHRYIAEHDASTESFEDTLRRVVREELETAS